MFDEIIRTAPVSNPWMKTARDELLYEPDFSILERLLAVPVHLSRRLATPNLVRSGVPALALDVWLSFELRRAGFDADGVWPRALRPRILPMPVAALLKSLRASERKALEIKVKKQDSASILGKNYLKQVDVVMSDWITGPELLISTKRMDSSYGKNAANRVEEAYGDAKNLRLRHPLAALGFLFCVRSDILDKPKNKAAWIMDQLIKLGREDDAYDATCLIMIEYAGVAADAGAAADADDGESDSDASAESGDEAGDGEAADEEVLPPSDFDAAHELTLMPSVRIVQEPIPPALRAERFLARMVWHVLEATPIDMHKTARKNLPADAARLTLPFA